MTTDAMPTEAVAAKGNGRLTLALSVVAVLLGAGALGVSLTHRGPQGAQGPAGSPASVKGLSDAVKTVGLVKECLPELTTWINGFQVQTGSDSNGNLYSAYLDTSSQQIAKPCQDFLHGK